MNSNGTISKESFLFQVGAYKKQVADLEDLVDRLRANMSSCESKRQEAENKLMLEENIWKSDKAALEEKLQEGKIGVGNKNNGDKFEDHSAQLLHCAGTLERQTANFEHFLKTGAIFSHFLLELQLETLFLQY